MSAQTPLLPSLFSLLPPTVYAEITSHLSLQAIHAQTYTVTDTIYQSTTTIIPGQLRNLRLRARLINGQAKDDGAAWDYSLAYLSAPLSGREYADMNVRGFVGVDIVGKGSRMDIEDFIKTLGFEHSHTYTRSGTLFHIPTPNPNLTLHLSITKLKSGIYIRKDWDGLGSKATNEGEPWLVELQPSKPVLAVGGRGEMGLGDVMGVMKAFAGRIDGLDWSTGR